MGDSYIFKKSKMKIHHNHLPSQPSISKIKGVNWFTRFIPFFGFTNDSLSISYLGLPIGVRMNRFEHWALIINKFQRKLSNWKVITLSSGGRLTLCKSVLGSLSLYLFSLFKAPTEVTNFLESIRLRFF